MNLVVFKGRLVADPDFKQTQSGTAVCKFRLAVNRSYKEADGTIKADFISFTAWKQSAEFISKYFKKGQEMLVRGELRNADYEKDGVKHYAMDVLVDKAEFCGSKAESQSSSTGSSAANIDLNGFEDIISDGEVPF